MKAIVLKVLKFFHSLVTDKDWDGDTAKFFGLMLLGVGVYGFIRQIPDFQWVIGFGAGMIGTGKWSEEKKG